MAEQHTPGPWSHPLGVTPPDNVFAADGRLMVADFIRGRDLEEQFANVRLIAAAPDMLEALEALVTQNFDFAGPVENALHLWEDARDAIAKARGE